ncbi:unnamed protein product [Vitrella brassicaformis CCMP3155]|uniref:Uncharacterized protein n=1 Tax=Vitrella brassicaformis (strain CCMP3155) TaxID=1169540 RepID=A0A0G4EXW0_VITBC|nr:unnamed protein product [Vitrella brassicaformis CCMP3155]|eukprot:CEM03240.1 unnamed protein product [Vitrella brassicaformis CCMP3155]
MVGPLQPWSACEAKEVRKEQGDAAAPSQAGTKGRQKWVPKGSCAAASPPVGNPGGGGAKPVYGGVTILQRDPNAPPAPNRRLTCRDAPPPPLLSYEERLEEYEIFKCDVFPRETGLQEIKTTLPVKLPTWQTMDLVEMEEWEAKQPRVRRMRHVQVTSTPTAATRRLKSMLALQLREAIPGASIEKIAQIATIFWSVGLSTQRLHRVAKTSYYNDEEDAFVERINQPHQPT